jgi:hypothetical protein
MKPLIGKILGVSMAILGGALTLWMVRTSSVWAVGEEDALCVLELQGGSSNVAEPITTSETLEQFFVMARLKVRGERLSLKITGEEGFFCSVVITKSMRFSFRPDKIPPATYKAVLQQETGSQGGRVVIAERQVGLTGWQIWSRAFVGLLVFSGVLAGVARKSRNRRWRATSSFMFRTLLLAFILLFIYLLFHEGGHALGAGLFGRYDWTRSDFWGIHGTPHSGIKPGTQVEPWQRAIESFAGPMFPTLMGWAVFLLWRSRLGKRMRSSRPMLNLYLTAIVAISVFPFVAVLGCLIGLVSDGDWRGFIENVPGPLWLVKSLILAVVLVNGFILWRIVPELWRAWKAQKAEIEAMIRQPTSKT